jgi:hypothetical protein
VVLPIIGYTLSTTNFEIRAKSFLLGIGGGQREGEEWVVREGVGAGGRNEPSLVCTYE